MSDTIRSEKVVLITGASSGLGYAMAEHLLEMGHIVIGTSRKSCGDRGRLRMLVLDLTNGDSVQNAVQEAISIAGRIDVLVNNAGVGLCGAVEDTSMAEAHWQMETNFFGPARMIRAVLPHMRRQGGGRIITITSLAGIAALPYQAYYSASKSALEGLNEALRLELAGSNIDATTVSPGDFATGFTAARVFASGAYSAVHERQLRTTLAIYEHNEREGASPQRVADLVGRLVMQPKVGVRYTVGSARQRLGIVLKTLLPAAVFEQIMKATYAIH